MSPIERLRAATALYERQDLPAAERELSALIRQGSDGVRARTLLGLICAKSGRTAEAQRHLEAGLRLEPKDFEALAYMAKLRRTQNDMVGALHFLQRALTVRPSDPNVIHQIGLCWMSLDDAGKAVDAFRKEVAIRPQSAEGHFHLGMALSLGAPSGASVDAFEAFVHAAERDPGNIAGYVQILGQMKKLQNWHDGLPVLEEGLKVNPDSPVLKVALAITYGKVKNPLAADRLFQSARDADPAVGLSYAQWLQEDGQFEASTEILKDSIRLGARDGLAFHYLAEARTFSVDGLPTIDLISERLTRPEIPPQDRMYLSYAIAKAYDNQGDYEAAMRYFDMANDLAYRLFRFNETFNLESMNAEILSLQKTLSAERVAGLLTHGSPSEQPIFIVGMIRSGTTLLDQILSSHPSVRSAGEQPFWVAHAGPTLVKWQKKGADPEEVRRLASDYLDVLTRAVGEPVRITDKMPVNYRHLGLIRVAFPEARIIHLRRNPLDTALSIYTTYLGRSTNFAYHQKNIVGVFLNYLQAMEYWRDVLPSHRFCEVDYERLVSDKDAVTRQLIAFCGLEWDDACLSPEKNRGSVHTPSLWTARQPVNTRSVGRWRRYEPWLGNLLPLSECSHPSLVSRTGKGFYPNTV